MGYRGRELGGQHSECDTEEGNGAGGQHSEEWDTEEGSGIESTQRNGIQRKGTGWTALRGMGYRGREWDREHSEEWDTEEGNGVDSTQRNGIQRKGVG